MFPYLQGRTILLGAGGEPVDLRIGAHVEAPPWTTVAVTTAPGLQQPMLTVQGPRQEHVEVLPGVDGAFSVGLPAAAGAPGVDEPLTIRAQLPTKSSVSLALRAKGDQSRRPNDFLGYQAELSGNFDVLTADCKGSVLVRGGYTNAMVVSTLGPVAVDQVPEGARLTVGTRGHIHVNDVAGNAQLTSLDDIQVNRAAPTDFLEMRALGCIRYRAVDPQADAKIYTDGRTSPLLDRIPRGLPAAGQRTVPPRQMRDETKGRDDGKGRRRSAPPER